MTIRVEWDNPEQTRVMLDFYEPYTWAEFHESIRKIQQMAESVPQVVDILIWMKVGLPAGAALPQIRAVFKTQTTIPGRMIVVNEQPSAMLNLSKRLANTVQTLFPGKTNLMFVETLEQARHFPPIVKA